MTARKTELLRLLHAAEQRMAEIDHRLLAATTNEEITRAVDEAASLQISLDDLKELIRSEKATDNHSSA